MIICCGLCISWSVSSGPIGGYWYSQPKYICATGYNQQFKGLLIPRMTDAEKTAIASPAQGLMIFNTTTNSFQYYNGVSWINFTHSGILSGTNNRIAKFSGAWGLQNSLLTDNASGVSKYQWLPMPMAVPCWIFPVQPKVFYFPAWNTTNAMPLPPCCRAHDTEHRYFTARIFLTAAAGQETTSRASAFRISTAAIPLSR